MEESYVLFASSPVGGRSCSGRADISHASVSAALSQCEQVLSRFGDKLIDATCADSADLTTANLATTNNAIATLPPFAFTPQADRDTIAPDPPHRTPIAGPVPGVQINARIAEDPQGQARVLIRLPDNWNGRLVVAGAPGTRSEFNGDLPGVITSCRKGMPTSHKTRVLLI
jgi:hypothetical protein